MTTTNTTTDFDFTPEHRVYFDELCLAVKDAQDNPNHWNQRYWHCNTSHCIAGFADMRRNALLPQGAWPHNQRISAFAIDYPYWGIDAEIFSSGNTLKTILGCLEHIRVHGFEYNRKGYGEDSYDREGYDKDGYDREGYDSQGYGEDGYNKDGYNKDGYDEDGYRNDRDLDD